MIHAIRRGMGRKAGRADANEPSNAQILLLAGP